MQGFIHCKVYYLNLIIYNVSKDIVVQFSSVQFSRSVMSNSLWPHEWRHTRLPCPSPTPGVHPNSRPLSWWCHPAISSSVVPFSSCPQSLPASESFPMSQLFAWSSQSTGVSALASVLPKNIQDWSPLEWTHYSMANILGNSGNSIRLFFWAPKSLQMVTAAMKLKDAYSLEEKLWPT